MSGGETSLSRNKPFLFLLLRIRLNRLVCFHKFDLVNDHESKSNKRQEVGNDLINNLQQQPSNLVRHKPEVVFHPNVNEMHPKYRLHCKRKKENTNAYCPLEILHQLNLRIKFVSRYQS
jgi:hypothetical protein